ncbi:Bax inhibitor-1 family protein [Aquabacterium sp.]|uniref:Bax inhibitor-1 family protein n=1 Tax=Aquabacterium sp. TaxID=1872578 RepID=UPI00378453CD
MESRSSHPSDRSTALAVALPAGLGEGAAGVPLRSVATTRVLRNAYALLALTLLFSAGMAALGVALQWPAPGLLLSLAGSFGLLFLVHAVRNSAWALPAVFLFTGFMGYAIGPSIARTLAWPGGAQAVALALGATGLATLALSAWALNSRRDFSAWGGMLFAGLVVALVAGLAAAFLQIPALALAVSAMVALLAAGMILVETSRVVHGGETNYVMAAVGLYVSIFNLFSSLLALFGIGGSNE